MVVVFFVGCRLVDHDDQVENAVELGRVRLGWEGREVRSKSAKATFAGECTSHEQLRAGSAHRATQAPLEANGRLADGDSRVGPGPESAGCLLGPGSSLRFELSGLS